MPTKPKQNQSETPTIPQGRDQFQTPNYATDLIVPFIYHRSLWECCAGEGRMASRLKHYGFHVLATSIETGCNALTHYPALNWDCAITNPPFSLKAKIVKRFIELDKPFAFLVPSDWSHWMIEAMNTYGCQLIIPSRRINYITPSGRQGRESSAPFHSMWLTRYFNLSDRIVFRELTKEMMQEI